MGAEGRADAQESHQEALEPGLQAGGTAGPQERPSEPGDPPGSKSQPAVSQDDGSEHCSSPCCLTRCSRVILAKI